MKIFVLRDKLEGKVKNNMNIEIKRLQKEIQGKKKAGELSTSLGRSPIMSDFLLDGYVGL